MVCVYLEANALHIGEQLAERQPVSLIERLAVAHQLLWRLNALQLQGKSLTQEVQNFRVERRVLDPSGHKLLCAVHYFEVGHHQDFATLSRRQPLVEPERRLDVNLLNPQEIGLVLLQCFEAPA